MLKLGLLILIAGQFSLAALPPIYQTAKDIEAVIKNPQLVKTLAEKTNSGIQSVTALNVEEQSVYRVSTGDCVVDAYVDYKQQAPTYAGPAVITGVRYSVAVCNQ